MQDDPHTGQQGDHGGGHGTAQCPRLDGTASHGRGPRHNRGQVSRFRGCTAPAGGRAEAGCLEFTALGAFITSMYSAES